MKQTALMNSESGIYLIAEEFGFLSSKNVTKLMLALSQRGPLTKRELAKLGWSRPMSIDRHLKLLEDQGLVVKVKRYRLGNNDRKERFVHYFCANEFIATAISEVVDVLARRHESYAEGFRRMKDDLQPLP